MSARFRFLHLASLLGLLLLAPGASTQPARPAAQQTVARADMPIPLVRQTYNNCGPASLSMLLAYYGVSLDQSVISAQTKVNPRAYMLSSVIDPFLRQFGLQATRFRNGNVNHVRQLVGNGVPVLAIQWLDERSTIPHFRIVRGFDDAQSVFYINDPAYGNMAIGYAEFARLWNLYGQEFVAVYPQGWRGHVDKVLGL